MFKNKQFSRLLKHFRVRISKMPRGREIHHRMKRIKIVYETDLLETKQLKKEKKLQRNKEYRINKNKFSKIRKSY